MNRHSNLLIFFFLLPHALLSQDYKTILVEKLKGTEASEVVVRFGKNGVHRTFLIHHTAFAKGLMAENEDVKRVSDISFAPPKALSQYEINYNSRDLSVLASFSVVINEIKYTDLHCKLSFNYDRPNVSTLSTCEHEVLLFSDIVAVFFATDEPVISLLKSEV